LEVIQGTLSFIQGTLDFIQETLDEPAVGELVGPAMVEAVVLGELVRAVVGDEVLVCNS
jgi:hypothetical protein